MADTTTHDETPVGVEPGDIEGADGGEAHWTGSDEQSRPRQRGIMREVAETPSDQISGEQEIDALEWIMSEGLRDQTEEEYADNLLRLRINVAPVGAKSKQYIRWVLHAVDPERRDELRREYQVPSGNHQERRRGRTDLNFSGYSAALVYEATVEPSMAEMMNAARAKIGHATGEELIRHIFRNKPNIIDLLADKVIAAGGDDEDVEDAVEVTAAGN